MSFSYFVKSAQNLTKKNFFSTRIGQPHWSTHPHLIKPNEGKFFLWLMLILLVTTGVTKSEYINRRSSFTKTLGLVADSLKLDGSYVALIPSNPESIMSFDIPYSYRQNSNLFYLTGYQEPNSLLLIDNNGKTTFFVRERDSYRELWDGYRTGTTKVISEFSIDESHNIESAKDFLPNLLSKYDTIFFDNNVNSSLSKLVNESISTPKSMYNINSLLSSLRLIKTSSEIELMKQSCRIAAESMIECMKATKPGISEKVIEATMEYNCKIRGAQRLSYPPVVASGINANTLHYITNDMLLEDGQLLLMDAGCEFHGYSSDITRSWPINGQFTSPQLDIYNIVLNANKKCIDHCRISNDVSLRDIHNVALDVLKTGLIQLGILNSNQITSLNRFYPHSTGHYLGMDVHDTNDIPTTIKLQPSMIITVEPGLYIPNDPDIPEKYRGIGIRIEDDVVITDSDPIVLTSHVPKDPHLIESIMNKK